MQTMTQKLTWLFCLTVLIGMTAVSGLKMTYAEDPAKPSPKVPASDPAKTPKIEITLDTTDAPEMAEWAEKAKKACEDNYPMIVKLLDEEGFNPPTKTKIVFKKMKGVAYTAGGTINCSAKWFTDHADDVGAVIHEVCHVVQGYHGKQPPSWVTEGIADYVRWFNFEPESRHPHVGNPARAKYTDSYQTTAAFFDWIAKKKGPQFVTKLNAASRQGKYKPELFQEYAGKPLDELWTQFVQSLKQN
jgi:hypothetical protein